LQIKNAAAPFLETYGTSQSSAFESDILDSSQQELPNTLRGAIQMIKPIPAKNVRLKRAYESPSAEDGTRVLVDRLWPRGVKKADAAIDHWVKGLSPSTELRKWFGHDPARWQEFRRRYAVELRQSADALDELRDLARRGPITLVYAARDETHNDAVVLRDILLGR
jgi:uncharacterized protein YeaO (DUF488 family)